ncbi:C1 family peptidase [Deinococcus sp.]|uniref:C1 family peptidase n=1 Tax=Deinococcus sp. TaxID=47478 RepID=UPI003CC64AB1
MNRPGKRLDGRKVGAGLLGGLALLTLGGAGAQKGVSTTFQKVPVLQLQTADISKLLLQAPDFGSQTLLPGALKLDTASFSKWLQAGNSAQFVTAAQVQANAAAEVQRYSANLQVTTSLLGQRPEFAALLELAKTAPFEEPKLDVQTKSGPITVRLMSPAVGLSYAAGVALNARPELQSRTLAFNQANARALNVTPETLQIVNTNAGATQNGVSETIRTAVTTTFKARVDIGVIARLFDPEGQGNQLDESTSAGCGASKNGIYTAINFELRRYLPTVKQQGSRGTCWSFATVSTSETLVNKMFGKRVNLSEEDYVANIKINYRTPNGADGDDTRDAVQKATGAGYRFAYENAWQYNQSWSRVATETPKNSGTWYYNNTCTNYPYASTQCSDTVHQAPTACIYLSGKTSCGFQIPATRSPYGPDASSLHDLWDFGKRDASLFWMALAVRLGTPIMLVHDARYLQPNADGFVADLPYNAASHKDASGNVVKNGSADVAWWNHVAELVGYVTNDELHAALPSAPSGAGGGYFILKNSWGSCFGDGGYVYLPWNWMNKYSGAALTGLSVRN